MSAIIHFPSFLPPSLHSSLLLAEFFIDWPSICLQYVGMRMGLTDVFCICFSKFTTFSLLKLHKIRSSSSRRHCRLPEDLEVTDARSRCPSYSQKRSLTFWVCSRTESHAQVLSWNPTALSCHPVTAWPQAQAMCNPNKSLVKLNTCLADIRDTGK